METLSLCSCPVKIIRDLAGFSLLNVYVCVWIHTGVCVCVCEGGGGAHTHYLNIFQLQGLISHLSDLLVTFKVLINYV